jgi:hypothetical protein
VRQRVARQLLDLVAAGSGPPLVVQLSQQELADEIGTVARSSRERSISSARTG